MIPFCYITLCANMCMCVFERIYVLCGVVVLAQYSFGCVLFGFIGDYWLPSFLASSLDRSNGVDSRTFSELPEFGSELPEFGSELPEFFEIVLEIRAQICSNESLPR